MTGAKSSGRLTLIQQNDIHAQIDLHWEHFWRAGRGEYRRVGGAARAATVANQIKAETDAAILVDCGDAIHGTMPALKSKGAVVVAALNAMGVDVMTPGNWEYAFGPDALWERIGEMNFPVLACNLQDAANGERPLEPFTIREIGGLRIGLVGITSPIIPQMSPEFAAGLRFPDVMKNIPRCIERLREREKVDLVVALSHLGFPQDVALAREIDGIDVILSGHTHNRLDRPARIGRTLIIQSGFSGSFLGRLDLEVSHGTIVSHRHELISLEEGIVPDPEVQRIVDTALAPYAEEMMEVVGQTGTPLHRMGLLETTMDNLITDAYLDLTGADAAFSHGWRYGPPVPEGDVTTGDLWAMIPTNPEIVMGRLTGDEIWSLLERNMESVLAGNAFDQAGGYLTRVSGVSVVFRPNNLRGTRIEHLEIAGEPYDPERLYTIAAMDARDTANMRDKQPTGIRAIEALRRYFGQGRVESPLTHRKFVAQ